MTIPGERQPAAASRLSPEAQSYLSAIDWDPATYPLELTELTAREAQVWQSRTEGVTYTNIGRDMSTTKNKIFHIYRAAAGKQELRSANHADPLALSETAQRVLTLNHLFKSRWHTQEGSFVGGMLGLPLQTLIDRARHYDTLFPPGWRSHPTIMICSPDTIASRVAMYDSVFSPAWRTAPALVKLNPETILKSMRGLATIGITQETTKPSAYFGLLGTTLANKRAKTDIIRRDILHHNYTPDHTKKPLGERVREWRMRTDQEKAQAAAEIDELKVFIGHMGAFGLVRSVDYIKRWAADNGYTVRGI